MARITDDGMSGSIGNITFYSMNGKKYARAKPGPRTERRNRPANPLNTIFGTVSRYGSPMVKRMKGDFLFKFSTDTYNRSRGWMRDRYAEHKDDANWELSVRNSGMSQLNARTDLRDFLKQEIIVTDNGNGKLTIVLPEMVPNRDINAPLRTTKVNIKMVVATSAFGLEGIPSTYFTEQYNLAYNNILIPAKMIEVQTGAPGGHIAIIAAALEYEISGPANGLYSRNIEWLPAAIIAMGRLRQL